MSDNIQITTTGRLTPCIQKKIGKTTYLVEVHFIPQNESTEFEKKIFRLRLEEGLHH